MRRRCARPEYFLYIVFFARQLYYSYCARFAAPLKKTAHYLDISERGAKIKDEYLFVQNSIIIEFLS